MQENKFSIDSMFESTTKANTASYGNDRAIDILNAVESHTDRTPVSHVISRDSVELQDNGKITIGGRFITKEGFDAVCSKTISGTKAGFQNILALTGDPLLATEYLKDNINRSLDLDPKFKDSKLVILNASDGTSAKIEAFHGSKYASLPNVEAMELAQNTLDMKGLSTNRWDLNGRQLRIEFLSEDGVQIHGTPRLNDVINHGVDLRNSEDGTLRFSAGAYLQMLACTNGMTRRQNSTAVNRRHIGNRYDMIRDIRHQLATTDFQEGNGEIIEMIQDSVTQLWTPESTRLMKSLDTMTDDQVDKWLELVEEPTIFEGFNHLNDYQRLAQIPVLERAQAEGDALNFLTKVQKQSAFEEVVA